MNKSAKRTSDSSPAVYCWEGRRNGSSPQSGRLKEKVRSIGIFQSSVSWTCPWGRAIPSDKSLGDSQSSATRATSTPTFCAKPSITVNNPNQTAGTDYLELITPVSQLLWSHSKE